MGDRAIITFADNDIVNDVCEDIGIYLHWNGNRHWVEAFVRMAKEYGFRYDDYGQASVRGITVEHTKPQLTLKERVW